MRLASITLALLLALASTASADPIADFYAGKTLRMLVGYGPGGSYDIYGRLVAEFLPRYLSGHPAIVTENMPRPLSVSAAGRNIAGLYQFLNSRHLRPGKTLSPA